MMRWWRWRRCQIRGRIADRKLFFVLDGRDGREDTLVVTGADDGPVR